MNAAGDNDPRRRQLGRDDFIAALDQWAGRQVAVRVLSAEDELVAVSHGQLGERADRKHPAHFWPLAAAEYAEHVEEAGVYLHPGSFEAALMHEGDFVLEVRQGGVTLNVRRL